MTNDIEAWKITACALGELEGAEAEAVARAIGEDPSLAREVDSIRLRADRLTAILAAEPAVPPAPPRAPRRPTVARIGRWVFTPLSLTEACAAAAMLVAAIGFGMSAWKDYLLKVNFDRALAFYASNQLGNAREALTSAMAGRGSDEWPYPLLLSAKIDVEEGNLDEGERAYEQLKTVKVAEDGWTRQHVASVFVGLGCVYLRRYDDSLESGKPNAQLLEKAKAAFGEAQTNDDKCLEAGIGLAHAALRRGWDGSTTPGKINPAAIEIASKELKKVDAAGLTPTIDGLVDKYMAQGRIAYEKEDYTGAELEFRRAFELQPSWKAPFANVAFMMARSFIASTTSRLDEMAAKQQEYDEFVQRLESLYDSDPQRYTVFRQAMYSVCNSIGYAFAKGYRLDAGFNYLDRALSFEGQKPTVYINKADIYYYYSRSNKFEESQQINYANCAREQWSRAAEVCRSSNQPRKRFLCLMNKAIILYAMRPTDPTYQEMANADLQAIAREFPNEPLLLRNQGMVFYEEGKITEAAKAWGDAVAAAQKSPMSDEEKAKFDEEMEKLKADAAAGK